MKGITKNRFIALYLNVIATAPLRGSNRYDSRNGHYTDVVSWHFADYHQEILKRYRRIKR